jgi:hypothetical protein
MSDFLGYMSDCGRSETFTKADGPADHILHLKVRFARWRLRRDSTAIRSASPGQTAPKFGDHHPNTQAPPNEQAGIEVPKQPLVARGIGPLLNKQGKVNVERKTKPFESEFRAPTE